MTSFQFWQRWLLVVGCFLVGFGLFLAFFSQTAVIDLVLNNQIDPVFWPKDDMSQGAASFQAFIYGVVGATIAGWGVFVVFLAHYPFRNREIWARNCIFAGTTLWYVTDSTLSAYFGVFFNVAFNTAFAVAIYVPLALTRNEFRPMKSPSQAPAANQ